MNITRRHMMKTTKMIAMALMLLALMTTTVSASTCTYRCSGSVCWIQCN